MTPPEALNPNPVSFQSSRRCEMCMINVQKALNLQPLGTIYMCSGFSSRGYKKKCAQYKSTCRARKSKSTQTHSSFGALLRHQKLMSVVMSANQRARPAASLPPIILPGRNCGCRPNDKWSTIWIENAEGCCDTHRERISGARISWRRRTPEFSLAAHHEIYGRAAENR